MSVPIRTAHLLSLFALLAAQVGHADESRVYTQRTELASGRTSFQACFHLAGDADDRCELAGRKQGYSRQELHQLGEKSIEEGVRLRDGARSFSFGAGVGAGGAIAATTAGIVLKMRKSRSLDDRFLAGAMGTFGSITGGIAATIFADSSRTAAADRMFARVEILNSGAAGETNLAAHKARIAEVLAQVDDSAGRAPSLSDSLLKELDETTDASSAAGGEASAVVGR